MGSISLKHGTLLYDDEDAHIVEQYHWYSYKENYTFYARANVHIDGRRTTVMLHRLLMPKAALVDHENRDGLDNRRLNLREASHTENRQNQRQRKSASGIQHFQLVNGRFKVRRWDIEAKTYKYFGSVQTLGM